MNADILRGKFIVLGVTGSIAVYKVIELARRMTQAGATVQVVMTPGATQFVQPLTFQALTYRPVEVEMFGTFDDRATGHSDDSGFHGREIRQPQRRSRPCGQHRHRRGGQQAVGRPCGNRQRGSQQQEAGGFARRGSAGQLRPECLDPFAQFFLGQRWVGHAECRCDTGGIGDVPVAAALIEGSSAVEPVGKQEAVDFGDVDPFQ